MKRIILFAVTAMAFLASVSHGIADTEFTLNIPSRSPKVPIGKVRITLHLDQPPGTPQLIVQSPTSVVTLTGDMSATLAGDKVSMYIKPGSNDVVIFYQPLSQFASVDNLCTAVVTGAEAIKMKFVGPAVTSYRINSYTVPKMLAGDEGYCFSATRRVKSNAATISGLNAANKGRHPLDVILVLDKSGSMTNDPPGEPFPMDSKWTILMDSVERFVTVWEQADMNSSTGGGLMQDLGGDRLGLIFFNRSSYPHTFAETADIFRSRGTAPPGSTHNWRDFVAATTASEPGGDTSIGAGLNTAFDRWNALDEWKNDAAIILMTDGDQNTAPKVDDNGGTLQLVDNTGVVRDLYKHGIPIQTIGFGTPATVEQTLLEKIAKQTAGASLISIKSSDLPLAFENALIESLKGNTLSLITRHNGTLTRTEPVNNISIPVNPSIKRLVISLSWDEPGPVQVRMQRPLTSNPVTPASIRNGDNWLVQTVETASSGSTGTWNLQVGAVNPAGMADIPYRVSVLAVEEGLEYRHSFQKQVVHAGEPIVLQTYLSFDGEPLTNANGTLTVRVEAPQKGLGNVLHEQRIPLAVLKQAQQRKITAGGRTAKDAPSLYETKIEYLIQKADLLSQVEPKPLQEPYYLRDDGATAYGDMYANDGIYSFKFSDTQVAGLYRFIVTVDIDDARTGRIYRVEKLEKNVSVKPSLEYSDVLVSPRTKSGKVMATVTLKDRYGNIFGPGTLQYLAPKVSGTGRLQDPITDPLITGDYTVTISSVSRKRTPELALNINGISAGKLPMKTKKYVVPKTLLRRAGTRGAADSRR